MVRHFITVLVLAWLQVVCYGQQKGKEASGFGITDSLPHGKDSASSGKKGKTEPPLKADSATPKKHDPHKATLYSTFCPGLGQIYNRKYWKLPLVYAAVGIPAYTYFYNRSWYRKCQYAIAVIVSGTTNADSLSRVDPKLTTFVTAKDDNGVRSYRNEFRKDQDYSVIFFLLFWGLQIVDATVDAHLMNFDISNNLSLHIRDGSGGGGYTGGSYGTTVGFGVALDIHKARYKPIPLP